MKIRCPKCSNVISLGINELPSTGLEIHCPSCSARFRLRSKGSDSSNSSPPPPTPTDPPLAPEPPPPTPSDPPPAFGGDATPEPNEIFGGDKGSGGIFGSGGLDFDDEPEASAPPPAPSEPPAAPSSAGAEAGGGAALDGLADLLQELDDIPANGDAAGGQTMYHVRGQRGNVFGPFDEATIHRMLDNGQLTGAEELSTDGQYWSPMVDGEAFGPKAQALQAAAAEAEAAEPTPETPEEAAPAPTPAPEEASTASVARSVPDNVPPPSADHAMEAAPIKTSSVVDEEVAIRRIERKSPQRIRSALRDDVMETEGRGASFANLPAIKEGLQSIDRKWLIMGGAGLGLVVLLAVLASLFLGGPKVVHYKDVNIPMERLFALDSLSAYTKKLLPFVRKKLRKQPKHPQLRTYHALALALYLEHYGPNRTLQKRLDNAIRNLPKPDPEKKEKPTALQVWAKAMHALVKRKGGSAWKHAKQLKAIQPDHYAIPYIQAKAQMLRRRYPQSENLFKKAATRLSSSARVNYGKGLLYQRWKKWDKAFQAYYQTTLINKEHFPAYLSLLKLEPKFPQHKTRYKRIWKEATTTFQKLKNRQVKARLFYMQALRAAAQDQPNKALVHLLAAIRTQPNNRTYQRKLPDFYLATYDYSKTIFFLKKMMSRKGKLKPGVSATFLQVLFRIGKADMARKRVEKLIARCPLCKTDHDFWIWRARVEEATKLYSRALNSYNQALALKKNSVAALASKARVVWKANHPKLAKKILKKLKPLKPKGLLDRLNLGELYLLLERPQDALDALKPLFGEYPRDEYINRMAGQLYLALDQAPKAEKHFRQALQTWPKDFASTRGLAKALGQQKKHQEAIPLYLKVIAELPNKPSTYFAVGEAYYETKQYEKAVQYLRKGLELQERNHKAHFYMGAALAAQDKKENQNKVIDHLKRAVNMQPNNQRYMLRLAREYARARQTTKALQMFTRLLKTPGLSKEQRIDLLLARGKIWYDLKYWRRALKDFRKLNRLAPKKSILLRWIADTYRQMNRKSQAIRWYQRALRHYKKTKPKKNEAGIVTPEMQKWQRDQASVYERLGDLERGRNRHRKAIYWFKKSVKLYPDKPVYYRQLGYLHKDLKRWSRCVRNFKIFLKKAPKNDLDRPEVERDLQACENARRGRY